jgi:hypothetical protein
VIKQISTEALLDTLYRSISAPDSLSEFLVQLNHATRSHVGATMSQDLIHRTGTVSACIGIPAPVIIDYEQRYAAENVWYQRLPRRFVGAVNTSEESLPLSELRTTTFWLEYLKLVDIDHCIGMSGALDAGNVAQLTVCRSHRIGPYSETELRLCQSLTPHWVNACQIRKQLGVLHDTVVSLEAALDRVALAIAFVDANGHVQRVNHGAERLLVRGDVVALHNQRLVARDAADAWRLRDAIAAATGATRATARLVLHDAKGIPTAFVNVHPLARPSSNSQALVFIRSAFGDTPANLSEVLAELFELTPSEARLTAALYAAGDLAAAAQQVGITADAARQRLKLVFDKTDAHGQPALVKLIGELHSVLAES